MLPKKVINTNKSSLSDLHNEITQASKLERGIAYQLLDYFHAIISCMAGNVFWLDEKGRGIGCNKGVLDTLNITTQDEFFGLTFEDMTKLGRWTKNQAESFKRDTLSVIESGVATYNVEEPTIPGPNGSETHFISSRVPLFNRNNEVIGIIGVSADITDIKKMEAKLRTAKEQAERSNRAKSEFMANMGHDIRTPLMGLMGLAMSIQERTTSPETRDDAKLMLNATQELLQLLNEILEVSKLESNRTPKANTTFNLIALLNHNINLLKPAAKHKKIELRLALDPTLPIYITSNQTYLDRTILNLISNAVKFTHQGFAELKVTGEHQADHHCILTLQFKDTGIGIPENKYDEIFEHFSRLNPTYDGIYKGFGLGLYTVKQYIKAMNGRIDITSTVNKGTTFTVTLPVIVSDAAGMPPTQPTEPSLSEKIMVQYHQTASYNTLRPTSATNTSLKTTTLPEAMTSPTTSTLISTQRHILIVEDNDLAARFTQKMLDKFACPSAWAQNGQAALATTAMHPYSLILMDIGLGREDGSAVTQLIRNQPNGRCRDTPIIAVSGHMLEEKQSLCLKAGMQAMVTKPLTIPLIQEMFRTYLPSPAPYPEFDYLPTLDYDEIEDILTDADMTTREIVQLLLNTLPKDINAIEEAYALKQYSELEKQLHRLHGGLTYCGVPKLRETTRQLNRFIQDQDYTQASQLMPQFIETAEELIALLIHNDKKPKHAY